MTWKDVLAAAQRRIEQDDELIYDIAADHGQIVDNVKHMEWFRVAVALELVDTVSKYEDVPVPSRVRLPTGARVRTA